MMEYNSILFPAKKLAITKVTSVQHSAENVPCLLEEEIPESCALAIDAEGVEGPYAQNIHISPDCDTRHINKESRAPNIHTSPESSCKACLRIKSRNGKQYIRDILHAKKAHQQSIPMPLAEEVIIKTENNDEDERHQLHIDMNHSSELLKNNYYIEENTSNTTNNMAIVSRELQIQENIDRGVVPSTNTHGIKAILLDNGCHETNDVIITSILPASQEKTSSASDVYVNANKHSPRRHLYQLSAGPRHQSSLDNDKLTTNTTGSHIMHLLSHAIRRSKGVKQESLPNRYDSQILDEGTAQLLKSSALSNDECCVETHDNGIYSQFEMGKGIDILMTTHTPKSAPDRLHGYTTGADVETRRRNGLHMSRTTKGTKPSEMHRGLLNSSLPHNHVMNSLCQTIFTKSLIKPTAGSTVSFQSQSNFLSNRLCIYTCMSGK